MIALALFDEIERVLQTLETLDDEGRHDLMVMVAQETGGYFKPAEPGNSWDSQAVEIRALGVYAQGGTPREAIRNWSRAAAADSRAERELRARVREASDLLRWPGPVERDRVEWACRTILENAHAAEPETFRIAQHVARAIEVADEKAATGTHP